MRAGHTEPGRSVFTAPALSAASGIACAQERHTQRDLDTDIKQYPNGFLIKSC